VLADPHTSATAFSDSPPAPAPEPLAVTIEPASRERSVVGIAHSVWASSLKLPVSGQRSSMQSVSTLPVQWSALPNGVGSAWLQFDDGMPRRVSTPSPRVVGDLLTELGTLGVGEHRLSWFATDSSGHVSFDAAGQPLIDVRTVVVEEVVVEDSAKAGLALQRPRAADSTPSGSCAPATLVAPHGTFNGAAVQEIPLEFWAAGARDVTVRGERGREYSASLTPGSYILRGLKGGDYSLSLSAAGCAEQRVSITLNPELDGESRQ